MEDNSEITYQLTTVSFRRVFLTSFLLGLFVYVDAVIFYFWSQRDISHPLDIGMFVYITLTLAAIIAGSLIFTKFFIKNHAYKVTFNEQGIIKYKRQPILIPWSIIGSFNTVTEEEMPYVSFNALYQKFSKRLEPEAVFYFTEQPSRAGFSHEARSHRIRVPDAFVEKVKAYASEKIHLQPIPPLAGKKKKQLIWIIIIFAVIIIGVPLLIVISS